jgi:BolA protein
VNGSRLDRIRTRLTEALAPAVVELTDDSHLHAGHAGARDGRGHFSVRVVSQRFAGLTLIARHQLVYRALEDMMRTDIHALSIAAQTPEEAARLAASVC